MLIQHAVGVDTVTLGNGSREFGKNLRQNLIPTALVRVKDLVGEFLFELVILVSHAAAPSREA